MVKQVQQAVDNKQGGLVTSATAQETLHDWLRHIRCRLVSHGGDAGSQEHVAAVCFSTQQLLDCLNYECYVHLQQDGCSALSDQHVIKSNLRLENGTILDIACTYTVRLAPKFISYTSELMAAGLQQPHNTKHDSYGNFLMCPS